MGELREKVYSLPELPGVYIFKDIEGSPIYIGKAKSLRKRVLSYFQKTYTNAKIALLVKLISDIEYIVTNSPEEALILENNLIKEYHPRFNVQWRDDKTYPWLVLTNETFPRLIYKRRVKANEGLIMGPFPSSEKLRTLINTLRGAFYIRSCSLNLTSANVKSGKYKPCIEYHIKRCLAPCCGYQPLKDYLKNVEELRKVLTGGYKEFLEQLKREKEAAVKDLNFEKAHFIKLKAEAVETLYLASRVQFINLVTFDVLGYAKSDYVVVVCYARFNKGHLVFIRTKIAPISEFKNEKSIIESAIFDMCDFSAPPNVIISRHNVDMDIVCIREPQEREEMEALLFVEDNAMAKLNSYRASQIVAEENKKALIKLKEMFDLPDIPQKIEGFDNSNLGKIERTSACVVFVGGMPAKKLYRYYRIKDTSIRDDYSALEEVLTRRYSRLLKEKDELPSIVVIDGGKGHLNVAKSVLSNLGILNSICLLALAKGDGKEIIYSMKHRRGLILDKNDEVLKFLKRIMDEAHRFCRKLLHKRESIKKTSPYHLKS